ncbi:putative Cytoplasmic dynein 2 heavy chain 1 [Paratrimastix pyriformis]|uniref:Cytoplasmic dynein 2 heavy chain 1 n=1 Tax=Paratrimastix pyriformis TaxID=342808 RepID=A0ABQ8UDJ7_9EUKA|nr:putative Cytoplasmic dynein 2 heavy chain 1 [Paratrimastix pyriformis]
MNPAAVPAESFMNPQITHATPTNLADLAQYEPNTIKTFMIRNQNGGTMIVLAFDVNQTRAAHTVPFDANVQILEGDALITVGDKPIRVSAGQLIVLPAGVPHSLKSEFGRFKMLLTLIRMAVIFLSDEDLDVPKLVRSWIRAQPEDRQLALTEWMDEFLMRALNWLMEQTGMNEENGGGGGAAAEKSGGEKRAREGFVLQTTRTGTVRNALSHVAAAATREEFALSLCRGLVMTRQLLPGLRAVPDAGVSTFFHTAFLISSSALCPPPPTGANLPPSLQADLCRQVLGWAGLSIPDPQHPLACQLAPGARSLQAFEPNQRALALEEVLGAERGAAVVETVEVQSVRSLFRPWLQSGEHFLLVGPEGAGKNMLLQDALTSLPCAAIVATIHCTTQTTAAQVITQLRQHCNSTNTAQGRVLRPKSGDRLILHLADLHLPRADKYRTVEVVAFAQQLATYGGFYDSDLEWVRTENLQIIGTLVTNTGSSATGAAGARDAVLSPRFTASVHVAAVPYPSVASLQGIYRMMIQPICGKLADTNPQLPTRLSVAMLEVYRALVTQLTPDAHPHYVFTPRDLTRWVVGMARYDLVAAVAPPGQAGAPLGSGATPLMAWAHEGLRIMRDRLVLPAHMKLFDAALTSALQTQFRDEAAVQWYNGALLPQEDHKAQVRFCTWGLGPATGVAATERRLRLAPADDMSYGKAVSKSLQTYEREVKELNLMLFPEVFDHIARLDHTLSWPGASAMLVGRCGVGRRSLTLLVSHMHGMTVFSPSMGRGFDLKSARALMKEVLRHCTVKNEGAVFFLEDYHLMAGGPAGIFIKQRAKCISAPTFLRFLIAFRTYATGPASDDGVGTALLGLVNALLTAGEVPGLFTGDEMEELGQELHDAMEEEAHAAAKLSEAGNAQAPLTPIHQAFIRAHYSEQPTVEAFMRARIRRNLHIVLSCDPTNAEFEHRLVVHPALHTRCQVIWMGEWSINALKRVALLSLKPVLDLIERHPELQSGVAALVAAQTAAPGQAPKALPPGQAALNSVKKFIVLMAIKMHNMAVQLNEAAPRDFIRFLQAYCALFAEKLEQQKAQQAHLKAGLSKLAGAAEQVDSLKKQAAVQQQQLTEKQAEADQALTHITASMAKAGEQKKQAETLQVELAADQGALSQRKVSIEAELAECQPKIDAAKQAVGHISQAAMEELKGLPRPPEAIPPVLSGVFMLMETFDSNKNALNFVILPLASPDTRPPPPRVEYSNFIVLPPALNPVIISRYPPTTHHTAGVPELPWQKARSFLLEKGVRDQLLHFDAHAITPHIRQQLLRHISDNPNSFDQKVIGRVSQAAAPLALWVKANLDYSVVLEKIAPLEREFAGLSAKFEQSTARLNECRNQVTFLDNEVARLRDDFKLKTAAAEQLKVKVDEVATKLVAAQSLLQKLDGERSRWAQQIATMNGDLAKLPVQSVCCVMNGDLAKLPVQLPVPQMFPILAATSISRAPSAPSPHPPKSLLAAGFATYLCGAPEDTRAATLRKWLQLASSDHLSASLLLLPLGYQPPSIDI